MFKFVLNMLSFKIFQLNSPNSPQLQYFQTNPNNFMNANHKLEQWYAIIHALII